MRQAQQAVRQQQWKQQLEQRLAQYSLVGRRRLAATGQGDRLEVSWSVLFCRETSNTVEVLYVYSVLLKGL